MIKSSSIGIRSKLLISFFLSLFIAVICGIFINSFIFDISEKNYNKTFKYYDDDCNELINEIKDSKSEEDIKNIIQREINFADIYILDNKGNVLIKNSECKADSFDIDTLLNVEKYYVHTRYNIEYTQIVSINNSRYIYVSKRLSLGDSGLIMAGVSIVVFIALFFIFTYKEINYIKELSYGLKNIAEGNLNYKVNVKGKDEISKIAKNINYMTEKLYESKEEEKLLEEKKDLFIMNISHDLRTPLTSIIGYIDLIKEIISHNGYGEIKEYVDIISLKSDRLNTLINDFFDYNKISFGKVNLNKVKINLNEFIRQITEGMLPALKERNLNIALSLAKEEINAELDPEYMYRVIENLIMNASKYSDFNTEIKIGTYEENDRIIIFIENVCKDFNDSNIRFIFDKFYKGDTSRSTKNKGAGLGLAIAKGIVKMHNGEINAFYKDNKLKIIINI